MGWLSQFFVHPLFLGLLAVVPLLWWLMRILPPPVRKIYFPTAFLLKDIAAEEITASRMPWWLIALRALAIVLFILAFAHPILSSRQMIAGGEGDILLVFDNGWASASHWNERMQQAQRVLEKAAQSKKSVIILPTASRAEGEQLSFINAIDHDQAKSFLSSLKPMPWSVDHAASAAAFQSIQKNNRISQAVYISEGLTLSGTDDFLNAMQSNVGLTYIDMDRINQPVVFYRDDSKKKTLSFTAKRLGPDQNAVIPVRAFSEDGSLLDKSEISFRGGETSADYSWNMPQDIALRATRFEAGAGDMASAVFWQVNKASSQVGILSNGNERAGNSILDENYYLRRALQEKFTVHSGTLDLLLQKDIAVLVWPDSAILQADDAASLQQWVENGGRLIRFSGVNLLAQAESDPLLPVELRRDERVMKSGLTGQEPLHLKDISADTALSGMEIPKDVTVTRQALAVPTPDVFEKTWISLEDGTPFVTAGKKGKGDIVLIHTTAGPSGSTLCYSGFYVEMLERLASNAGLYSAQADVSDKLVLQRKMDGFGRLESVSTREKETAAISAAAFSPSPETPPGIYSDGRTETIFNLSDRLGMMMPLRDIPSDATRLSLDHAEDGAIRQNLLLTAFILFFADVILRLLIIRNFNIKKIIPAAALMALCISAPAMAQTSPLPSELTSGVYVGHLKTGDTQLDNLAQRGLEGLKEVVRMRTTIDFRGVVAVDPENDDLSFYPVLYWPLSNRQTPFTIKAMRSLQNYMRQGGLLVIDTRDGNSGSGMDHMRRMLSMIAVPALMPVPENHILGRSFYLLQEYPGVLNSQDVWVEKEPDPNNDSVTSLLIGHEDWAAAWSFDENDRLRFAITPGGEMQREMSYRFGVNMMMMALAGNYKSDQIHVNEILKRFGP